ncbi:MAG TPA: DUF2019 domain-containing protein [Roseiarcus sp.]|nr:DUF2019 domain-containing protein [Roseiarcus sp.]
MIAEDVAQLSTKELIQRFVATAKATPTLHTKTRLPEGFTSTPEWKEGVAQMQALGAALRERKPIEEIRPLFEDDDADVRSWSAAQFLSTDPEWASAAWSGLCFDLTTREAFDLTRRARQPPPRRPTIKDMSDDALVERFEDAATREYAAHFLDYVGDARDMAIVNRIQREVWAIADELKSRAAAMKLLPYLDHRFITVRREAATACLSGAPDRAQAVLETIVASHDLWERSRAWDALDHWRGVDPMSPTHVGAQTPAAP